MGDSRQTILTGSKFGMPNIWDIGAICVVLGLVAALGWGAKQMALPFSLGTPIPISLSPSHLPVYALRSILRMFIGIILSLIFTFIVGTWAAKNKRAEKLLIPIIDIFQSVPVLAFQAIAVLPFIALFPNSLLGPECVCIFAIFTAQVWNMTLSFYQSLRSVPHELREAADMYRLSSWQRFWRIEVPHAVPGLLWNTMMSMSASWFFVVASEAIVVAKQNITLPGVGSYIAVAILHADKQAVVYAIITMLIVIALYDQLVFRPLIQWSEKFLPEQGDQDVFNQSWVVNIFRRTQWIRILGQKIGGLLSGVVDFKLFNLKIKKYKYTQAQIISRKNKSDLIWRVFMGLLSLVLIYFIWRFLLPTLSINKIISVFGYGLATTIRVIALIIISSLIWIPIGVWIGMRPKLAMIAQPLVQFMAAFPAYLLYPVVFMIIVKYKLNVNIWCVPLMMLGAQWYILFNVIAGSAAIPKDLKQSADNMGVKGLLWWRKIVMPAIFPYFITGAITAAGGAWNASIVAEVVDWGHVSLKAVGLGAYITQTTQAGNFPAIALGISVMSIYVVLLNRFIWRPLYNWAEDRFKLE